jgi:Uma2 family endonuclease
VTQKPMPQGQHSLIQGDLVTAINAVTRQPRIALALPELRCTFAGRSIIPDIAVFIWEQLPTNADGTIANQFYSPPDWTIEILSPDQSSTRVTSNIVHCLTHGSQLGWLIDPQERLVLVYAPNQPPLFFDAEDNLLPAPEFAAALHLTLGQLMSWLRVG